MKNCKLKIADCRSQTDEWEPDRGIRLPVQLSVFSLQLSICNVLFIAITILATGCNTKLPGKPNPADVPVPENRILDFATLYSKNCAGCHGADGTLGPAPPLNDPLFRAIVPQTELTKVLKQGRKQGDIRTQMAPFAHSSGGTLTDVQVEIVVSQIKGVPYDVVKATNGKLSIAQRTMPGEGIQPKWGVPPAPPETVPPYLIPKLKGDATRGAQIFAKACAGCHGKDGMGETVNGQTRNRINDLAFLTLTSDQALRRLIITGRPDLGMPNYAEKTGRGDSFKPLTSSEINDVNALLGEWRQGKAK